MSMYLPNPAVHPSESDPVEFIEPPPTVHQVDDETSTSVEQRDRPVVGLSPQARVDIARRTHDYITELVAIYSGDRDDVRSIIHDLHHQITVTDRRRRYRPVRLRLELGHSRRVPRG